MILYMITSRIFMTYLKLSLAVVVLSLMSGCFRKDHLGFKVQDEQIKKIKIGVTTMSEVVDIMGAPPTFTTHNNDTFFYGHHDTKDILFVKDIITHGRVWVIVFDEKKVVKSLNLHESSKIKNKKMAKYDAQMQIFRPI